MKKVSAGILTITLVSLISGCATITGVGKDNTPAPSPLITYSPAMKASEVWETQAGKGTALKGNNNLVVGLENNAVITADYKGNVTALNAQTGKKIWASDLKAPLVAGPEVDNGIVIIGGQQGQVWALDGTTGKTLWQIALGSPLTSPPVIVNANLAILKTLDGQLVSLNPSNGTVNWKYSHPSPLMVLAGGSRPIVIGNKVIAGFPDGKLGAYTLSQGRLIWETQLSQPQGGSDVDMLMDVIADPTVSGNTIYVVNYQGNLSAINVNTGQSIWQQPLSSYTGIALSNSTIYVTDADGLVWAFNRSNGQLIFKNADLKYRKLSAPIFTGNAIVVGDGEGYIHWLSPLNGKTLDRIVINKNDPILASAIEDNNGAIYIVSAKGKVAKITSTP